jgi:tetratricopeptide (TPR) repeat protein
LTPSSSGILNNIGVCYARRNELGQARHWFEKAFVVSPFDAIPAGNLGLLCWDQGEREKSHLLLERAIHGGFRSPAANYVMGLIYLAKGLTLRAVKALRKAEHESLPHRELFLAVGLQQLGKYEEAAKCFKKYLRARPVPMIALTR